MIKTLEQLKEMYPDGQSLQKALKDPVEEYRRKNPDSEFLPGLELVRKQAIALLLGRIDMWNIAVAQEQITIDLPEVDLSQELQIVMKAYEKDGAILTAKNKKTGEEALTLIVDTSIEGKPSPWDRNLGIRGDKETAELVSSGLLAVMFVLNTVESIGRNKFENSAIEEHLDLIRAGGNLKLAKTTMILSNFFNRDFLQIAS